MFKKYFKTPFSSLVRKRNYTINNINITGLAVGIAVFTMILIIQFHTSFDAY